MNDLLRYDFSKSAVLGLVGTVLFPRFGKPARTDFQGLDKARDSRGFIWLGAPKTRTCVSGEIMQPSHIMKLLISHVLLLLAVSVACPAVEVLEAGSFALPATAAGAASAGQPVKDLTEFIKDKLRTRKTLIVPPGEYRIKAAGDVGIVLSGLQGKTLIFDGVKIIMENQRCCLQLLACKDMVIRGLTVDYDPLPFSQGQITKIDPETMVWEVELCDGYPSENLKTERMQVFSPRGALVCSRYSDCTLEMLAGRTVRVTPQQKDNANAKLGSVGDVVVFSALTPGRGPAAIIHNVEGVNNRFENITVYSGFSTAFHDDHGKFSTFQNCRVIPCPPEKDYTSRSMRRYRSVEAYGFVSANGVNGPKIIGCVAANMGDGGALVYGDFAMVMTADKRKARIIPVGEGPTIQKGDMLEFIGSNGVRLGGSKVLEIKADGQIDADEAAFLKSVPLRPDGQSPTSEYMKNAFMLRLDHAVEAPRGSLVISMAYSGNGCVIRSNRWENIFPFGLLIRSSGGSVSSNVFVNCAEAIRSSPDFFWLSGGVSTNLAIEHNQIEGSVNAAIIVEASGSDGAALPAGAHQNIRIVGNKFANSQTPAIVLGSTRGAVITNNKLVLYPRPGETNGMHIFKSENVVEKDNEVLVEERSLGNQ